MFGDMRYTVPSAAPAFSPLPQGAVLRAWPMTQPSDRTFIILYELRGNRLFTLVSRALREETKNSMAEDIFEPPDENASSWAARI